MELRHIDPRALKPNPDNPRRTRPDPAYDAQLAANIKAVGLIQPPVVREIDGELTVRAGDRRVAASIEAGLDTIPVLVRNDDESNDTMRAFAENSVRTGLGTVDIWRAMQALAGEGWTDDAVATALSLPPRTVRRLKLCGNIHPAILDHMAHGDEPSTHYLALIAAAAREDQAQAWKKFKPSRRESVEWHSLAHAVDKRRMHARDARFGDDLAKAYGIIWSEDLFAEGHQDNRYTTQVDAFLGAQHEWMANNLPRNGIVLQVDNSGEPKLPPKAVRVWGKPDKRTCIGTFVDEQSGAIETITYRMPEPPSKNGKADQVTDEGAPPGPTAPTPGTSRPPVTKDGLAMIGDFRTDALHETVMVAEIDDLTLVALLTLAFAGKNVEVHSGHAGDFLALNRRHRIVGQITPGAVLTHDPETIRNAAREMLRSVLALRETGYRRNSGPVARIAGEAVGADRLLPPMATEDFLSCLSKPEIERVAGTAGVLPRQTGKATRAAVVERFKDERFIYDRACFALTEHERSAYATMIAERHSYDLDDDPNENTEDMGRRKIGSETDGETAKESLLHREEEELQDTGPALHAPRSSAS